MVMQILASPAAVALQIEVVGAERWRIYEMPEPFAHDRRTWIDNRRIPLPCGISIAAVDTSCASSLWSDLKNN